MALLNALIRSINLILSGKICMKIRQFSSCREIPFKWRWPQIKTIISFMQLLIANRLRLD